MTETAVVTLDAGVLIAAERGGHRAVALLARALERSGLRLPAGVLAQVWRAHPRQHRLHRLLSDERVQVVPLDREEALLIGALCARTGATDVVDVSVVTSARSVGGVVVTSDPDDIAAIDPDLAIISV